MPKISAATVVEHRAAREADLVRAGEALLLEAGIAGITLKTVSERAGLTRSSFYDYFPSKDDLLVAIAITAMDRWATEIDAALSTVEPGLAELRVFVDATLAMTADGKHAIADALREAELSPSRFEDLMELHDLLLRPVLRVLTDLGLPASMPTATLVQSVLGAGIQLVSHGIDHRTVADDVYRLLTRGLFA